jgi:dipeptidase
MYYFSKLTNIKLTKTLSVLSLILFFSVSNLVNAQYKKQEDPADWEGGVPEGCTTITVGKDASFDGSVMTSHTDDSHRTRTWLDIVPAKDHPEGAMDQMVQRKNNDTLAMPAYKHVPVGEIPEVSHTYKYINTAYPCINEHQLAIGESTFGGRKNLRSKEGLIDCQQLVELMLKREKTARGAIRLADSLLSKYGWNDYGEALTIADPNEVWHLEIVGPGKGNVGAIWAAQRVPDDEVSVNANASRILEVDLSKPDYFMASDNLKRVAADSGWFNPEKEEFKFAYAYADRSSMAARRREWRVLDLVAPSLGLDPNAENYPFSVKPDTLVTLEKMVRIFSDYYEGTPYNFIKNITWVNDKGEHEISPLANPFMPYDMNKIFDINGGWNWRGERTIARWYTIYATIIQCRDWLPDEIGGVAWLAWDNVASSVYSPLYCGIEDVPDSYKKPGRVNGYNRESAWWAFNRLGTLTAQRWGDMRYDVREVFDPMQKEIFQKQKEIEKKAEALYREDPEKAREFLTEYSMKWGNRIVDEAWKLGDFLWTKYDEEF